MASTDVTTIEKGTPLHDLALNVDISKVPEKVICKFCKRFLLNPETSECCSTPMCETCVASASQSNSCPECKHTPFSSVPRKSLRNTARAVLRNLQNNNAANRPSQTNAVDSTDAQEVSDNKREVGSLEQVQQAEEPLVEPVVNQEISSIEDKLPASTLEEPTLLSPSPSSRQAMAEASADTNDLEDDDDIEINVGEAFDMSQLEHVKAETPDEYDGPSEGTRRESIYQQPQEQKKEQANHNGNSFKNENISFGTPSNNGMNMPDVNMPFSMDPAMMQNMMMMMQSGGNFDQNSFMSMMSSNPLFYQNSMNFMQSWNMGGMANGGINGMGQAWLPNNNMMGQANFANMNMFNNGASFPQAQQQFQQFPNGDFRTFNQNGKFSRGNRRGRGRRGGYYQQDNSSAFNMQNQSFNQNMNQFNYQQAQETQAQFVSQDTQRAESQTTRNNNIEPEIDANDDDDNDDFAPGGREDVVEALGEQYTKEEPADEPDVVVEQVTEQLDEAALDAATTQDHAPLADAREPSPSSYADSVPVEEAKATETIPEAYREDLEYAMAPPSAPLGPSVREVAFRGRGHGRFPSRSRGSFQGSNGYAPRSPIRSVSQVQTQSPPANKVSGVVGAPTGPRAMREKEAPPSKAPSRSDSDMGLKIMGRASTQSKDAQIRDDTIRSTTPRSGFEEYTDRDRLSNHRVSRRDTDHADSRYDDRHDEYERDRDRKRRKSSRREDDYDYDYDMQDIDQSHTRADSPERTSTSHKSSRRDRERHKEKYDSTGSKHKSSSRRHEETPDEHETDSYGDAVGSKSHRSVKKSSRHEEREKERDSRDFERSEKDKHRKRSRHDREREEDYQDEDETDNRRRSRKHKREHLSTRRDRDRDQEDTDLGMRISGRSSSHRNSEAVTPVATPQPDKDPHTLEREARNRERMQKEQQRRENAAKGTLSGGRRISYKYEDELDRSMSKSTRRR